MLLNGRNHFVALEWKRLSSGKKTTKRYPYPLTGKAATETNYSPFLLRVRWEKQLTLFSVKKIWGCFWPNSLSARTGEQWNRDSVAGAAGFRQSLMPVMYELIRDWLNIGSCPREGRWMRCPPEFLWKSCAKQLQLVSTKARTAFCKISSFLSYPLCKWGICRMIHA